MQDNNGGKEKQSGLSWSTPHTQNHQPKPAAPSGASTPNLAVPAAASASGSSAAKYIGMAVVGVLAGVLIAWGWSAWRSSAPATQNDTSGAATTTGNNGKTGANNSAAPGLGSDPALTILSPQPSGTSVSVSKAIVSEPTWIVVYENKEGKPGNALGAALFFPERQTGAVELLRATVSGRSYLAVKQVDNGDRKFSLKDDQYLSEGGEVQWVNFEVR